LILSLEVKLIALFVAFSLFGGISWYVHHHIYQQGWDDSKAVSDKQIAKERATASVELAKANDAAAAREHALTTRLSETSLKLLQDNENAAAKIASITHDLRDHALQLSIAIANRPKAECGKDTAVVGQPGDESRPDAAEFLVQFAGRCDATARQLNSVIDAYNAAATP
jgi:hypothetical protein